MSNLPATNISTELAALDEKNNTPAAIAKSPLAISAPFRPTRSANHDPPNEPIVPPIRKMDTMEDQRNSSWPLPNDAPYLVYMLSLQKVTIICKNSWETCALRSFANELALAMLRCHATCGIAEREDFIQNAGGGIVGRRRWGLPCLCDPKAWAHYHYV